MAKLTHVLQLRLTPVQHRFLVIEAHRQDAPGQGAIARQLIDEAIDRVSVDVEGGGSMPLRAILEGADDLALEQLADDLPSFH